MPKLIVLLLLLWGGSLHAQTLDTISVPGPQPRSPEEERMLPFFRNYQRKSSIQFHLVTSAAPRSDGTQWRSTYAEGELSWQDQYTLRGSFDIMYSDRRTFASFPFNPFKMEEAELLLNVRSGLLALTRAGDKQIFPTTLRNNLIHGFNDANEIVILTLENH